MPNGLLLTTSDILFSALVTIVTVVHKSRIYLWVILYFSPIMKKNMGNTDRISRAIIAFILLGLYYEKIVYGTFGTILLIIAGILLLTALISYCPIYSIFNFNTRNNNNNDKPIRGNNPKTIQKHEKA